MISQLLVGAILITAPSPDGVEASNSRSMKSGIVLFRYDSASAIGSDLMIEQWKNYGKHTLDGYITVENPESWNIAFIGKVERVPKAYFESILRGGSGKPDTVIEHKPPRDLNDTELSMHRAKLTANNAVIKPWCSKQYNKILIPNGHGWSLYFLAATTEHGKVLFGGHYRIDVDSTGRKIVGQEQFSNSCLEMESKPGPDGRSTLVVSHLRSRTPTEIHVYLSKLHQISLFVGIKDEVWYVANGLSVHMGNMKNFKK